MNEIINKTDGTILKPTNIDKSNSKFFWLLYSDNKNNYSFTPTTNFIGKLFMIGGGGAGGYYFGGGGGAGAAFYKEDYPFYSGVTYNFSIGNGGKCDIDDFNSLFSKGLSLNIYNNVNIDFNNISFSLDDYSSLNVNNSGLIQNFIVNNYDTNITIPSSIWNNNTFYIWSGYIIPSGTDEYIKININTNINTAIWVDNYIYKNDNALILNTNNNYLSEVKIIKIDPKRYYNIKIIAYCNNNSSNNNFNISFSNNCSLSNYDKTNEKYIYLNATDTTLTFNNKSDNSIQTLICKGGGNGGCGFFNQNNNLDGGCGGGSGINKKNGKTVMNTSIYKGTDGAVGAFCGGGGGISSNGKDKVGGDGMILDWFDQKLFFGCGGNGGNYKDNRNYGYGCGGNGGDCCYYSKEIINNNGKNGCVLIYIDTSQNQSQPIQPTITPTLPPIIEKFGNYDNTTVGEFYNYITDTENRLTITQVYQNSVSYITNCSFTLTNQTFQGFDKTAGTAANQGNIHDATFPASDSITYAGFYLRSALDANSQLNTLDPSSSTLGKYGKEGVNFKDGKDKFFNYFKYNPSYIYNILSLHKCIVALYKIVYYQIDNDPYNTNFDKITLDDARNSSYDTTYNSINLKNIFNITSVSFSNDSTTKPKSDCKKNLQYINNFYGKSDSNALDMPTTVFEYNYTNSNSVYPPLPYYHTITTNIPGQGSTDNYIGQLSYIKDYLDYDFLNKYDETGASGVTKCYSNEFINNIPQLKDGITLNNVVSAYNDIVSDLQLKNYSDENRHNKELKLLYLTVFRDVLDPNSKSKIAGRLFYYAHYFNLIIINLNLQYGLYRLLFARYYERFYINCVINGLSTKYYFSKTGLGQLSNNNPVQSGLVASSDYNLQKANCLRVINEINGIFNEKFKVKDVNDDVYLTNRNNNIASNRVIESQLKLNKIIKKYNDELQIYNTTLNIYKAVIAISIVLLIIIIYIFTIDSNVLNRSSKISLFIILGLLLFGISVYFAYNNNLVYENFTDNKDIIETFTSTPSSAGTTASSSGNDVEQTGINIINDCHMARTGITPSDYYTNFKNAYNDYISFTTKSGVNYNKNYQGYITNFIYLAGIINYNATHTDKATYRSIPVAMDEYVIFDAYSDTTKAYYDYLRTYIASVFNIMTNSANSVDDVNTMITFKNKRNDFYENRYNFYLNSIETLKNEKYVYYYLSILYFLCVVLLLISLIIILIFGHSINAIIITSVLSFLVALIIVYYIYFKLHQHTRMKINKNYWAYNNPSDNTINDLSK